MFRLYRKSGFDTIKALTALQDTLKFRIEHRRELLWSPIQYDTTTSSPGTIKAVVQKTSLSSLRRDSTSSRTSAQSPRASPAPGWDLGDNIQSQNRVLKEDANPQSGVEESLLQLYPPSTNDPNKRPLIVVSLKYLEQETNSKVTQGNASTLSSASPTVQALAAFERLRCYLAESSSKEERPPLQFILIINLSGGRVSTTVRLYHIASSSRLIVVPNTGLGHGEVAGSRRSRPVPRNVLCRFGRELFLGIWSHLVIYQVRN